MMGMARVLLAFGGAWAAVLALATAATAQIDPDDTGAGTKLGLASLNNSGQVGTVTLFSHGARATLLVLRIESEPPRQTEAARVRRGRTCGTLNTAAAYPLAPVVDGVSRTVVDAPEAKLLSGNYVVSVHASRRRAARVVSCGELHS
jgi:hypothetical protein